MADETQLDWDRLERLVLSFNLWIGVILLFIYPPFEYLRHLSLLLSGCWRGSVLAARFRLRFGVFGVVWLRNCVWGDGLNTDFVSGLACLAWLYMELWFETSVWTQGFVLLFNSWRCWWMDTRGERIIERYILSVPALPYFTEFLAFAGSLM